MGAYLFENAALLDPVAGEIHGGSSVRIEGDRIVEVGEGRALRAGDDVTRIDVGGKTLMPGLIDAHIHALFTTVAPGAMRERPVMLLAHEGAAILQRMLRRGFTTVRDVGGPVRGLAMAIDRGLCPGPRMFYSGRALSQTGGHADDRPVQDYPNVSAGHPEIATLGHVVDGVDAVRKAAREELRGGASFIKVMAGGGVASPTDPLWSLQFSEEELRAAVDEAEHWRTYVSAHVYTVEQIQRSIRAGITSLEHCNLIDDATAKQVAERGAYMIPTLVTYNKIAEIGGKFGMPETSLRKVQEVLHAGLGSLEIAKRHGVKLGFGTDLIGEMHEYQAEEFTIRAQVLSPAEVIRSATVVNAEIVRQPGDLGVVAPNAYADLLVVDGNPLQDISLLASSQGQHLDLIMRGGMIVSNRLKSGVLTTA